MSTFVHAAQRGSQEHRWAGVGLNVVVLLTMLVAVTLRQGHEQFAGTTLLVFTFASWLPLLFRLRWPIAVLAATVTVESLHLIFVPFIEPNLNSPIAVAAYQPVPLATMTAAWTVASRSPRLLGWIAGLGAATTLLLVSLLARPVALVGTDLVMFNLVCIATAAGVFVVARKERAQRVKQEQEQQTREKVIAERLRIARELHDVLAHHLTLVNAQAGIANYLLTTDPQAAATALEGITDHTRSALDELRATVGLLRSDDLSATSPNAPDTGARTPVPTLGQLETLLDGFRSAGIAVSLESTGDPRSLTASSDLSAYRVIQEALTNAAKHAPGAHIGVTMSWTEHQLQMRVENGPGDRRPARIAGSGSGNGLIGMRERVHACGGDLDVGPTSSGGYVIKANIPTRDDGRDDGLTRGESEQQ